MSAEPLTREERDALTNYDARWRRMDYPDLARYEATVQAAEERERFAYQRGYRDGHAEGLRDTGAADDAARGDA